MISRGSNVLHRRLGRIFTSCTLGAAFCTAREHLITDDLACGAIETSSRPTQWSTCSRLTIVAMSFELLTSVEWLVALFTSEDCLHEDLGHVVTFWSRCLQFGDSVVRCTMVEDFEGCSCSWRHRDLSAFVSRIGRDNLVKYCRNTIIDHTVPITKQSFQL